MILSVLHTLLQTQNLIPAADPEKDTMWYDKEIPAGTKLVLTTETKVENESYGKPKKYTTTRTLRQFGEDHYSVGDYEGKFQPILDNCIADEGYDAVMIQCAAPPEAILKSLFQMEVITEETILGHAKGWMLRQQGIKS